MELNNFNKQLNILSTIFKNIPDATRKSALYLLYLSFGSELLPFYKTVEHESLVCAPDVFTSCKSIDSTKVIKMYDTSLQKQSVTESSKTCDELKDSPVLKKIKVKKKSTKTKSSNNNNSSVSNKNSAVCNSGIVAGETVIKNYDKKCVELVYNDKNVENNNMHFNIKDKFNCDPISTVSPDAKDCDKIYKAVMESEIIQAPSHSKSYSCSEIAESSKLDVTRLVRSDTSNNNVLLLDLSTLNTTEESGVENVLNLCERKKIKSANNENSNTLNLEGMHSIDSEEGVLKDISDDNNINEAERNKCHICSKRFSTNNLLTKHIKLQHNCDSKPFIFSCHFCDRTFSKKISLYFHFQKHTSGTEVVCQKCGKFCSDEEAFNVHMKQHADEAKLHCDICGAFFSRKQNYMQHIKKHKSYTCSLCSKSFSNKKAYVTHCRKVHKSVPEDISINKIHECNTCGKTFCRPSLLHEHEMSHTGYSPYFCKICKKPFLSAVNLKKHMRSLLHEHLLLLHNLQTDHSYESQDKYCVTCDKCQVKLPDSHTLMKHMKLVHSVKKTFSCQYCDYKTSVRFTYSRHLDTHLGKKKFICEFCGISFSFMSSLKVHYGFAHSSERKHSCDCGKNFKTKSALIRHKRSHSSLRPYKCHCGTSYKRGSHLRRHKLSAHNEVLKTRRLLRLNEIESQHIESNSHHNSKLDLGQETNDTKGHAVSDPILGTSFSDGIIYMGSEQLSDQNHYLNIGDSQYIQLIPSFHFSSDMEGSQGICLVGNNDLSFTDTSAPSAFNLADQNCSLVMEAVNTSHIGSTMVMVQSPDDLDATFDTDDSTEPVKIDGKNIHSQNMCSDSIECDDTGLSNTAHSSFRVAPLSAISFDDSSQNILQTIQESPILFHSLSVTSATQEHQPEDLSRL